METTKKEAQGHTPAPWEESQGFIASQEYEGCGTHTAVWGNEADKKLALAAPELLEALKKIVKSLTLAGDPTTAAAAYQLQTASIAIDKAEGRA